VLAPPAGGSPFAQRLRGREPVLGCMARADQLSPDLIAAVDALVLIGAVPSGLIPRLRAMQTPTLVQVESAMDVGSALDACADGVVATATSAEQARAVVAAARRAGDRANAAVGFGHGVLPRAAGPDPVVLIAGSAELAGVDGVDAVLSDSSRARLVTSPEAARCAFASGADFVLYDLPAMVERLVSTLPQGRQVDRPDNDREPFVLLSGMLGDASLWDGVAALLCDIVRPWPARIDLDDSVPELADSVLAQAPPRFALGGHSLGAIVALEIMRRAPERVTRLALVNASARGPVDAQQQAWDRWRRRILDGEFEQVVAELARATLATSRRHDEALVTANAAMARSVGPDGFLRQLSAQSTRPESRTSVAAIEIPVLVVSGQLDEVCPPELQRELVDHCPHAELVSIEGGGHMLPLECADSLAEQLRTWFARR
jgi:pimeloyl-ACP methyl ester carboxylesterase